MARSTRRSRRSSSLPAPDSDEEDAIRPYVRPPRLESPFATDRMTAAISLQPQQEQQPQQRTREQRASAAEQEQVLTAAALRRSAAARARLDGDTDGSIIDSLESLSVMNDGDDTGTFNCCNSLRNAGGHSAIQPVSSDIIDCRFRWRIHRMQDHYLTTPVSSPPCYCYGLRIRSSKPSPSQ